MPPSSNSLSSGSQLGQDGHSPSAAVASAAFSSEAAAMGAPHGNSFFDSTASGESVRRSVLSGIIPGGVDQRLPPQPVTLLRVLFIGHGF